MKRNLTLCIILLAAAARMPLKAQDFRLRSMDGKYVRVHVEELNRELRVSCLEDTLLLYESFGGFQVRVLDSSFLKITYAVRGGSGHGSESTAILAVRDGRLRQALFLTSSFETVGLDYHRTFNTSLKLTGNRWSNYVLTINAWEYLKDKSHPAGKHKIAKPILLRFNKDLVAFYGKTGVARTDFDVLEFNHSEEYIHFATGDTLTMTDLSGERYYYVEGSWYTPIGSNLLTQQDPLIKKVFTLPTVQQKNAWIDSVTCHRHGISLMIPEGANWSSDSSHYSLQVGYHSGQRFEPYYLLNVYPPDSAIKTLK